MWIRLLLAITFSTFAGAASAEPAFSQARLQKLLRNKIETVQELAANEAVVRAVQKQNGANPSLEKIKKIDKEWLSTTEVTAFKRSLQENEVGRYFKIMVRFTEGIYSEAFLTDRKGANLAAYPATTDYWQGDERKWIEAFNHGKGNVYIGSVEFDESTKTDSVQISVPVLVDGKAIGVLIVGIRLSYLQAKYLKGL